MILALKWFAPITLTAMGLAWISEQVALLLGFEPPPQDLVKLFTNPNVAWQIKAKYAAIAVLLAPVVEELIFRMGLFRFCLWCGRRRKKDVKVSAGKVKVFLLSVLLLSSVLLYLAFQYFYPRPFPINIVTAIVFSVLFTCPFAFICWRLVKSKSWTETQSFPVVSALISGAVFATVHFHAATFLPLWFLGVAFAWLYWKSGTVFSSMLCHFLFNLVNLVLCLTCVSSV
jgi:membrane protease YdiL (CAAX protease family)